ncbi:MAG: cytochrome c biogenesis protein CcdA, partial [Candidatus Nanopelagicales bacterium]
MISGWALAFTAGVLAAFNPCGFALLPTYLTMFLSGRQGGSGVVRALAVGAWVTAGFVLTFGVVGIAVSALSVRFGTWLSVVTVVLGVGLVAVGSFMLSGRD